MVHGHAEQRDLLGGDRLSRGSGRDHGALGPDELEDIGPVCDGRAPYLRVPVERMCPEIGPGNGLGPEQGAVGAPDGEREAVDGPVRRPCEPDRVGDAIAIRGDETRATTSDAIPGERGGDTGGIDRPSRSHIGRGR